MPAGTYTITAVARDNVGAETTSTPITVTVIPAFEPLVNERPSFEGICTGMNDKVSVKLSPNPAKNILNIYTSGLQKSIRSTISILSASGVILKSIENDHSA